MELIKIIKYLDKKFDPAKASDWDKVGFQQLGKKNNIKADRDISSILVCLDLTMEVVESCIENKVDLVITRHPFIFVDLDIEKKNPSKREIIKILEKHNINVFSIHTNYDASVSQSLFDLINNEIEVKKFKKFGNDKESNFFSLKKELKIDELISTIKKVFSTPEIRTSNNLDQDSKIKDFYITTGSGASTMIDNSLVDTTFITGEVKWHEWIYANDNNVNLIEIGHYMENYFVKDLKNKLINNFKEIKVIEFNINRQFNQWKE